MAYRNVRRSSDVSEFLGHALRSIGWSLCQVERRSRVSRHRICRWLDGVPAEPGFVAWIAALDTLHRQLATPLSIYVTPGRNRPLPTAYEIAKARMTIGWSERQLTERGGIHRTTLRRLDGQKRIEDWRFARWLELLTDGHSLHPHPEFHSFPESGDGTHATRRI